MNCKVEVIEVNRERNRAYVAKSVYATDLSNLDPLDDWTNCYMALDEIEQLLGAQLEDGGQNPFVDMTVPRSDDITWV